MKFYLFISLLLVSFLLCGKENIGTVDFRIGELFSKNSQAKSWQKLDELDSVAVGDTLKTGAESKCELLLVDGSTIRLSENTIYYLGKFENISNKILFEGKLLRGECWSNVNKADKSQRDFRVMTPTAVAAVIGTKYKFKYDSLNLSEVSVYEGKVQVDLNKDVKDKILKKIKDKKGPQKRKGPQKISGPHQITLKEWVQLVSGDVISINDKGKYYRQKIDVKKLKKEWNSFRK